MQPLVGEKDSNFAIDFIAILRRPVQWPVTKTDHEIWVFTVNYGYSEKNHEIIWNGNLFDFVIVSNIKSCFVSMAPTGVLKWD